MSLLDRAKLPTLLNRRLQDIVILMYKVKYRLVPDFICDIYSPKSCKYNLRNQNVYMPRFNSVLYGKHSLRYLGPFLWNKLKKKSLKLVASLGLSSILDVRILPN